MLFHGVNVIYKVAPYIPLFGPSDEFTPQESLVPFDMDNLIKWGMNHVRLGVMWEAVETAPGVYNYTYLDEVENLINAMGEKGIMTMIDMHQDVLTRMNCGEGMPAFYAEWVAKNAKCYGDWSDPKYDFIKENNGMCKSIHDYNYNVDDNGWPVIAECN